MTIEEFHASNQALFVKMLAVNSFTHFLFFKCRRDEFIRAFITNEREFERAKAINKTKDQRPN